MKVAVVAPTAIPARSANTLQVMKMSQALINLGHELRLAAPSAAPVESNQTANWSLLAHHYGIQRTIQLEWLLSLPRLRKYDYAWRAVKWAQCWGAEYLYTRLPQAAAISSFQGIPTILETHDQPSGTIGPILFKRFLKGRGAQRLVVISLALQIDLINRFGIATDPTLTVVAPDGVDIERYAQLPGPEQARKQINAEIKDNSSESGAEFYPDHFTAGYTGHLYPGRGVELILEIADHLPEINFLLVGGEPNEVADIRTQVKSLGLRNVIVPGFIPNADLPRYQAACEVLLMPYQEKVAASSGGDIARYLSPMKVFEYMACGRAILSSDLPVLREVLSEENSILLPPGDLGAWVAALQRLQETPQRGLELGYRARQEAQQYTWEARAARIFEGLL